MTKLFIGITRLCEFRSDLAGGILKIERAASMIYRILIDEIDFGLAILLGLDHPDPTLAAILDDLRQELRARPLWRLRGVNGFGHVMDRRGLRRTLVKNRRARFYFTHHGWKTVGRFVAAEATRMGHVVKVIRQKQPARSQIVYGDELQLAILPAGSHSIC